MEKPRCQAILLMPKSRRFTYSAREDIRCKWSAKDDSNFCGVHSQLNDVIHAIIWRDQ